MTKEEFEAYLVSIGGLNRTWRADRGLITEAGFFECGPGWYGMIKNLIEELIAIGWNKNITQVKEKFGGLRFYTDSTPEGGDDIISKYETISYKTCEECGKEGVLRKGGWLSTFCDEHAQGREPMEKVTK